MSKITSMAAPTRAGQIPPPAREAAPVILDTAGSKKIATDCLTLSDGLPSKSDMEKALFEELKTLQKDFPKVQILIGTGLDASQLKDIAAGLGEGKHVILSRDWLQQITSSAEAFEQGKQVLRQIISGISKDDGNFPALGAYIDMDGVRVWHAKSDDAPSPLEALQKEYENMTKMLDKMKEETKKANDPDNKPFKVKVSNSAYSVSRVYGRLASASSKSQVQAAMSEARRNIGTLRIAASQGTNKEKAKARAAMASLQKALLRGSRKIRRLGEEDLTRARKKRAEKKEQQLRLRIELQKKKSARRSADRAIALEGHLDDVNNAFRFRKLHKDDEREEGPIYSAYPTAPAASVAQPAPISAPVGEIAAADVVVSEVMAF